MGARPSLPRARAQPLEPHLLHLLRTTAHAQPGGEQRQRAFRRTLACLAVDVHHARGLPKRPMAISAYGCEPDDLAAVIGDALREVRCHIGGTATLSETLPDTPTVGDFVAGYEASGWNGVGTPTNTPAEIVEKLNREINAGLADPKLKARLGDLGGTAFPGSPADFGKHVADETKKWAKVVKFAGIKPI